ncbi:hypothetical protein ACFL2U_00795 [Patescibacteria group bacterium]
MKFEKSNIVTAFDNKTIGSKVTAPRSFLAALEQSLEEYDQSQARVPGQFFITLPEIAHTSVSAGVGERILNPDDYVIREHRGQVNLYLKRTKAAPVESLAVVVYTKEAYLNDPDVQNEPEEAKRITASDAEYVIVAVLASSGPQAALTPHRFVHNLAGGNKEALVWTADEIRAKAEEIKDYHEKWCVVAD